MFGDFHSKMSEHIREGPIGDFERAFRRSVGLDETVSEAEGIAREISGTKGDKILAAIRGLDEKAGKSDTKAAVYFWVGLGVGLAGLVFGVVGIVA